MEVVGHFCPDDASRPEVGRATVSAGHARRPRMNIACRTKRPRDTVEYEPRVASQARPFRAGARQV